MLSFFFLNWILFMIRLPLTFSRLSFLCVFSLALSLSRCIRLVVVLRAVCATIIVLPFHFIVQLLVSNCQYFSRWQLFLFRFSWYFSCVPSSHLFSARCLLDKLTYMQGYWHWFATTAHCVCTHVRLSLPSLLLFIFGLNWMSNIDREWFPLLNHYKHDAHFIVGGKN